MEYKLEAIPLESPIQAVLRAESGDFFTWARMLGLDPKRDFAGADLSGTNLRGADLIEANLIEANLSDADLSNANLSNANLNGANLYEANLYKANLRGAYFVRANLEGADLRNADLINADVQDTIMSNCMGLSETQIVDLKSRGAIFEYSPGDRSSVLSPTR